jgi:hypothetical protein
MFDCGSFAERTSVQSILPLVSHWCQLDAPDRPSMAMIALLFEVLQEGGTLHDLPRKVICDDNRLHLDWTAADGRFLADICGKFVHAHLQALVPVSSSVSDGGALVLAATLPWVCGPRST